MGLFYELFNYVRQYNDWLFAGTGIYVALGIAFVIAVLLNFIIYISKK